MKCNWIEKKILKLASKIIDKHKLSNDPLELSPFVLDMLDISYSFDKFVQHMASLQDKKEESQIIIPIGDQKYKS